MGLPAPWLMWWVFARGCLPVLPIIGQPNGGPFYFNFSRGAFVALLAISFVLAFAQRWAGWLVWAGKKPHQKAASTGSNPNRRAPE